MGRVLSTTLRADVKRQDRAEATRLQILHSAASAFDAVGFSAANINDIVDQANVTKGALYFHFESKTILARALIDERSRRLRAAVKPISDSRIPALEKLIHATITVAMLVASDEVFRAGEQLLCEVGDFAGTEEKPVLREVADVSALLETAIAEGDVADLDAELTARLIVQQFLGSRLLLRAMGQEYDLLAYVEELWRQLIRTYVCEAVQPYFRQLVARMITAQRAEEPGQPGHGRIAVPSA